MFHDDFGHIGRGYSATILQHFMNVRVVQVFFAIINEEYSFYLVEQFSLLGRRQVNFRWI